MTAPVPYARTDTSAGLPRWLALVLATVGTLLAVGVLWSLAPSTTCGGGEVGTSTDGILPGPQPCTDGGTTPALVTSGILLALLAALYVVAFTVIRHRMRVVLWIGGAMLLVLIVGLLVTVTWASVEPPVIYY